MSNEQEFLSPSEVAYDWIVKSIQSSKNPFHIEGCKRLIELFVQRFPDGKEQQENLLVLLIEKETHISYF